MTLTTATLEPLITVNGTRMFAGFPYLLTRILPNFYHIILLPSYLNLAELQVVAHRQVISNWLDTYLVLSENSTIHYAPDGRSEHPKTPPSCSLFTAYKLLLPFDFTKDDEFRQRKNLLDALIKNVKRRGGYLFGDLSKGGRYATPEELERLKGFQENGVPKGLVYCEKCGYYRGVCLDPNPIFKGMIMQVYCLCQNNNLCARCGYPLAEYKLNANYYEKRDGMIWHVPGFSGLSHVCLDRKKSSRRKK